MSSCSVVHIQTKPKLNKKKGRPNQADQVSIGPSDPMDMLTLDENRLTNEKQHDPCRIGSKTTKTARCVAGPKNPIRPPRKRARAARARGVVCGADFRPLRLFTDLVQTLLAAISQTLGRVRADPQRQSAECQESGSMLEGRRVEVERCRPVARPQKLFCHRPLENTKTQRSRKGLKCIFLYLSLL